MNKYTIDVGGFAFVALIFPHHRAILVTTATVLDHEDDVGDAEIAAAILDVARHENPRIESLTWSEDDWTSDEHGMSRVARVRVRA